MINETHIERRIVNNQFSTPNKLEKILGHIRKHRLVHQKLIGDTMHFNRTLIDYPFRIDVLVIAVFRHATID